MAWDKTSISLGVVKAKSVNKIDFTYEGTISIDPKTIVLTCSCTEAKWNSQLNKLTITFEPGNVPHHIKSQLKMQSYNAYKEIKLMQSINGIITEQTFTITAQVFDNLPNEQ